MAVRILILAEEDDTVLEDFVVTKRATGGSPQWNSERLAKEVIELIELKFETEEE